MAYEQRGERDLGGQGGGAGGFEGGTGSFGRGRGKRECFYVRFLFININSSLLLTLAL
jgi:hypothetical protein